MTQSSSSSSSSSSEEGTDRLTVASCSAQFIVVKAVPINYAEKEKKNKEKKRAVLLVCIE